MAPRDEFAPGRNRTPSAHLGAIASRQLVQARCILPLPLPVMGMLLAALAVTLVLSAVGNLLELPRV